MLVEPPAVADPKGSPARLRGLLFDIAGRLFSVGVLAWAIFVGRSSPLLFLWGLWLEEVLSLAGLSIRAGIVGGRVAGRRTPLGLYFLFPVVHLFFVGFFTLIATTGLFSGSGSRTLEIPRAASAGQVAAAFLFWTGVDVVRVLVRRRRPGTAGEELAAIDSSARLALFLPHVTIIAGGFCLVMFRLGGWLAWGILAGKVLFEVLSFSVGRDAKRRPRLTGTDAPRD